MTLIEKMARTIYSACECRNCGLLTYWENHTQECCDRPSWISASDRNKAIAALKAMREPPFTAYADADALNDSYWPGKAPVHAVWQAMIDQAIKEGE